MRHRLLLLAIGAALAGCGFGPGTPPDRYALAAHTLELLGEDDAACAAVQAELDAVFGVPSAPRWTIAIEDAAPSSVDLAAAAVRYRAECLQCHGNEGGGDGPASFALAPRPTDLRLGIFKHTPLVQPARARIEDLVHGLRAGVPGTSMPGFARLPEGELEGLAHYVRLLAVRGEVERRLAATWADEGALAPGAGPANAAEVAEKWAHSKQRVVEPATPDPGATPAVLALGAELFRDPLRGNCASCHGEHGAGDGPVAWKLGLDGIRKPAYEDAWGRPIVPRDLRTGSFRGGSRPIDLYRRIWAGIPGTPMAGLGTVRKADGTPLLSSDDVWALAHHARALAGSVPAR